MASFVGESSSSSFPSHSGNTTPNASDQFSSHTSSTAAAKDGSHTAPSSTLPSGPDRHPLLRSLRHTLNLFLSALLTFSDWTVEWTPLTLVVTYHIVSTAIFVMCSPRAVKVFYFFFMVTNFYIAALAAFESFLGLSPVRDSRRRSIKLEENDGKFPSPDNGTPIIDLVIVAYLPNERDIVKDQVVYALEELVYPAEKLRINLVYNTPSPIEPLETELRQMQHIYPQLRVHKALGSKSKADNLNSFFTLDTGADIIGIFDCDHFPHPHNPRWAAERFMTDPKTDIVQGRCIVYNTDCFYAKMIAVEFDKIYAISHPGRSRIFGFGLFCGSNGYWRADLLKAQKMNGSMLTEDIDSALRAYGLAKIAVHDMNVISYEMAPVTFKAFWRQRMRWAQGWTQASIAHMALIWSNPPGAKRGLDERFGLVSLLLVREMSYYLVTQHTCLLLSFIITGWPHDLASFVQLLFFRYPMAQWFLFSTIAGLIFALYFTQCVRSEFTTWRSMIVFCIIYIPYLVLMAIMGLYGHARQIAGYSSWNPTARSRNSGH